MFVVKECNTYPSPGIRTIVITTIKKMGVASQFADYTGRYARGKEYGLSKSGSDKFFTRQRSCDIKKYLVSVKWGW